MPTRKCTTYNGENFNLLNEVVFMLECVENTILQSISFHL